MQQAFFLLTLDDIRSLVIEWKLHTNISKFPVTYVVSSGGAVWVSVSSQRDAESNIYLSRLL